MPPHDVAIESDRLVLAHRDVDAPQLVAIGEVPERDLGIRLEAARIGVLDDAGEDDDDA